jgi:hypothetical protein
MGCDVRVGGCFIDGVHIRKLLQRLQITDNLAIPVNPGFTACPELLVAMVVGVILIEGFDLGGGCVQCQVDVRERLGTGFREQSQPRSGLHRKSVYCLSGEGVN